VKGDFGFCVTVVESFNVMPHHILQFSQKLDVGQDFVKESWWGSYQLILFYCLLTSVCFITVPTESPVSQGCTGNPCWP
jgi:hypothetical protein